ncbi:hypothetical protein AVEN_219378-1 [Araneus ventricosus]|uniref:Uncharacterized protein n=1 Tax=Araneus ventricosus TaxID=182803 RepID=A0A4Y2BFH1_ARAVE|nr:hypothetical protein AVEN_219378-1 [Araneus ventricosus]
MMRAPLHTPEPTIDKVIEQLRDNPESPDDLMVRSRFGDRRVPDSKSYSMKDPSYIWVWNALRLTSKDRRLPVGVVSKFEEGVPVQASFSSSGHCSKL